MVMAMASARFLAVFPLLLHSRSSASHQLLRRLATRHSPHLFLSPPIALLPLRPSRHSSLHPIPLKFAETLHPFQECQSGSGSSRVLDSWPEWSEFVNWVSSSGYCGNGSFDDAQFVQDLSPDFVRAANGCLHFARNHPNLLWSLPREDVEVVVESCSQFLFKDAFGTTRRMKAFLGIGPSDVLESDKPTTVDLMRFLLSYAHMAVISSENKLINSAVESSVRKLFSELLNLRSIYTDSNTSIQSQFPERYGQASRPFRKTIEMKRGDWTCPRCSFMNFAMNLKCRECEEPQPHKYLTGREWECPQCNFFNFGRNAICLRCDCNKPVLGVTEDGMGKITQFKESSNARLSAKDETGNNSFSFETTKWGVDTNDDGTDPKTTDANMEITEYLDEVLDQKSTSDMNNIHAGLTESENPSQVKNMETEEAGKSQRWINKVAEIYDVKDQSTPICNKDFPEIMPIRKGENRFVVSKKKDCSLTSPIYKRRMAMENHTSDNKNVPFVPFPPGYFASPNDKSQESSNRRLSSPDNNNSDTPSTPNQQSDDLTTMKSGTKDKVKTQNSSNFQTNSSWLSESQSSWMGRSLEGSAVTEPDPLDMSEEAKAERWFRRVAQIKDISELSQIPDEDFPSIMPMRKGVNRFVVSKRKTPLERRLTSSQYRRNLPSVNLDLEKKETDSG